MSARTRPLRERLYSRLVIDPETNCLLWTGTRNHKGYGYIRVGARQVRVHRLMYELFVEPVPEGLQLDHLCRVRHCASPAHMEAVTCRENLLRRGDLSRPGGWSGGRGRNSDKTHCDSGHEFTEANTYVYPGTGKRACRDCRRRWDRSRST
jgi:hypothetical protein